MCTKVKGHVYFKLVGDGSKAVDRLKPIFNITRPSQQRRWKNLTRLFFAGIKEMVLRLVYKVLTAIALT